MGDKTKIAWCDSTVSPWIGCAKCSPGCDRCYAKGIADRFYKDVTWGPDTSKWRDTTINFRARAAALERKAVRIGRPLFVFPSMCDPFYSPNGNTVWRSCALATPHLVWLLLTKRPEMIRDITWPKNVWLGVTAENQEWADKRIPILLQKQCAVRFVSIEPMLGPVDMRRGIYETEAGTLGTTLGGIHWVICGGESGAGARKMELPWAMRLASQCDAAGVPFWFKQWGAAHGRKMAHCDQLWGKQYHGRPEVAL